MEMTRGGGSCVFYACRICLAPDQGHRCCRGGSGL